MCTQTYSLKLIKAAFFIIVHVNKVSISVVFLIIKWWMTATFNWSIFAKQIVHVQTWVCRQKLKLKCTVVKLLLKILWHFAFTCKYHNSQRNSAHIKDFFGPVNKCLIINIKQQINTKNKIFSYEVHIHCLKFWNNNWLQIDSSQSHTYHYQQIHIYQNH